MFLQWIHTVVLPIQAIFLNQTTLPTRIKEIERELQGPTLVYYDEFNSEVDTIVRVLAASRPVLVALAPNQPVSNNLHIPRSFVLLGKQSEWLVSNLRKWRLWDARSRVLVVLYNESDVYDWLETLWRQTRAVNVLAMVLTNPQQYFTWFPYQAAECSKVITVSKLNTSKLFPSKIGSFLNSCPLLAVTTPLPLIAPDDFNGIEPRLFHTLAEKLGMKADYVRLPPNHRIWTMFDKHGLPINGLQLMWNNEVDIMFSNLGVQLSTVPYADYLTSHTSDTFVYYVPTPQPAPRATAIFRAFVPWEWALVFSAFGLVYVTIIILIYVESGQFRSGLLYAMAIILNLPTNLPTSRVLSLFACAAYLYSMHITTAYQASLMFFLSNVPRETPIRDLGDLIDSNLLIEYLEGQINTVASFKESPVLAPLTVPERIYYSPVLDLHAVAYLRKNAVLGPKLAFSFITQNDEYFDSFGYPLIRPLRETILRTSMCFYIAKGHPLQPFLNRYTRYLIEAGFPLHYESNLIKPPRPTLRQREPFSISNVEGPFILYLIGTIASVAVWCVELVVYAFMNRKVRKQRKRTLLSKRRRTLSERLLRFLEISNRS